jgi:molecular chaperone Hsp33
MQQDKNTQFLLPNKSIRGQLVQLDTSWQQLQQSQDYSEALSSLLGESLAAVSALASTVKLEGSMIMQVQGDGALSTLVAQANNKGDIRGLARLRDTTGENLSFPELIGDSRFVITIEGEGAQRYQGIVKCEGTSMSDLFNLYFKQSEQLATQLWLAANREQAACFLLQQLPSDSSEAQKEKGWEHARVLADTLKQDELLSLTPEELLHRLFHEEDVQVFPSHTLQFKCQCSREQVCAVIESMGENDAMALIAEEGEFKADCEFCGVSYVFDAVDIASLFSATQNAPVQAQ